MSNHSGDTNKMVGEYHLPDTGKMVSDTPMTDSELVEMITGDGPVKTITKWVHSSVCFQLERELNAANDRIKRLEGELESTKLDRDSWSDQSDEFAKTAADLIIRIKRLEEAGDELVGTAEAMDAWRKAKEDKP